MKSIAHCLRELEQFKEVLAKVDSVFIGAGAGLSAAAGLVYSGNRFTQNFADFMDAYHYTDMYSAGFYPYSSLEEYWGYWSRHIYLNRYNQPKSEVYANLLKLVENKDYFVLTTNVDHCFQKAGFAKNRLFYTQGDYGLWQCGKPCHEKTYDNEAAIRQMVLMQKDRKVPKDLVPYCPRCGAPFQTNLRCDERFVEDEGWHLAMDRYEKFLQDHEKEDILYLELGVGANTPTIIKYPFWALTAKNQKARYVSINEESFKMPAAISPRAVGLKMDIGEALQYAVLK
jgi:NAD-dependent SIR2 family protein deacetylase